MYYIDLFSGQGKYEDGTESTPIEVIKIISSNPEFKNKIQCIFNESDEVRCSKLQESVFHCEGVKAFKFSPIITNTTVDSDTYKKFLNWNNPSFVFLDPCGYKGLSMKLISSFSNSWGTDLIIFFNYNAINRSVEYESFESTMREVFGDDHYQRIKERLDSGEEREYVILDEMISALKDLNLEYVLPFCFKFNEMNRTSHYILFATKNILAFSRMKEIMYKEGGAHDNGEGKFEYIPKSNIMSKQRSLLEYFDCTNQEFKNRLLEKFSKRTISTR